VDIYEYISEVSKYHQINLGYAESLFLIKIAAGYNSAYSLFSYLKTYRSKPMAYKNVYKRVKRLEQINLIQLEKKFKRNAMLYKLTTEGLLYIVSNPTGYPVSLLTKYRDNVLLKTLLYPYFEYNTIKNCGAGLYLLISQYLRECCDITFDAFRLLGSPTVNVHEMLKIAGPFRSNNVFCKWIEESLEWHAKSFAFKLGLKYIEKYMRTLPSEGGLQFRVNDPLPDDYIRSILSKDTKFMLFLQVIAEEFEVGYRDLLQLNKYQNN
jgi:hypothetical protein